MPTVARRDDSAIMPHSDKVGTETVGGGVAPTCNVRESPAQDHNYEPGVKPRLASVAVFQVAVELRCEPDT